MLLEYYKVGPAVDPLFVPFYKITFCICVYKKHTQHIGDLFAWQPDITCRLVSELRSFLIPL